MKLDWNQANTDIPDEGEYIVEVTGAREKISKTSNHKMLEIDLKNVADHRALCQDRLMMEGGGAGIGYAKLRGLGIPKDQPELDPIRDLVGKRAKAWIKHEEYKGQPKAAIDISMGSCGYEQMEGASVPAKEDVPF